MMSTNKMSTDVMSTDKISTDIMSTDKMSTDIMSNRQNVEQTKCRTDKMSTDKMPNRQNVDNFFFFFSIFFLIKKFQKRKKNSLADWIFPWTNFFFQKSNQFSDFSNFCFSSYGHFSVIFGFLNFEIQSFRHSLLFHQIFCLFGETFLSVRHFVCSSFCMFEILSVRHFVCRHFVCRQSVCTPHTIDLEMIL